MEEIRQTKMRRLFCGLLPAALAVVILFWGLMERHVDERYAEDGLVISLDSGFYGEDQELTIDMPRETVVYYTDNCELPDREHGIRYTGPILVAASEEEKVQVYRFKAFYEDGRESDVFTRTYFTGKNIGGRYTTNVLHITGEPEGLFGYENGIFVSGKIFDEFLEENPGIHFGGGVDANFSQRGKEWEREVYIQYFDPEGNELLAQNGGIRISGNMTRMKNQKSFRLYARKEYDPQNEFRYVFLKDLVSEADGSLAKEYKRILVRSAGTDNGFAFLRSEMACALAADAGFPDVMYAEPVTVYINGEYRGIYWLENCYDARYFENRYGKYDGEFVVLEGYDRQKADSEEDTEQKYVDEYNETYQEFSAMDLTVEENYQKLQQFLDVENYLQYFAIENYVGNNEWPEGNLKAYRYVSAEDDHTEGTVFDGRYRHLLFDMDYSFGLLGINDTVGILPQTHTLDRILGEESPLFAALMEREDCRHYFINYNCDLINGAMSPEHVTETFIQMSSSREAELQYMLEETSLLEEEELWFWESATGSYDTVKLNYSRILAFAENRPATVLEDLCSHFDCAINDIYTLHLTWGGDFYSTAQVNSIHVDNGEFSGTYFAGVPVTLKPCLAKNERFVHWIVNGDVREEEELQLGALDVKEQAIHVELEVEEAEDPVLQINALRAKGTGDFIELINLSHQPVSTLGYFLSDGKDPYKYALPAMTMQPGETRRFYGKDCMDLEGLGEIGLNFNLKKGETVTLTYGEQTVESLLIPDLSKEGIYRRDIGTGKFREER